MNGLSGNALHLVLSALDDAADFRRLPSDWCDDRGKQPEGQECAEHNSDGAIARDYDELAERLRAKELERSTVAPGYDHPPVAGASTAATIQTVREAVRSGGLVPEGEGAFWAAFVTSPDREAAAAARAAAADGAAGREAGQ